MLPLKIQQQKELMQDAIHTLEMIESADWLLSYDKPMQKVAVENLRKQYTEIMGMLAQNLTGDEVGKLIAEINENEFTQYPTLP